MLHDQKLFKSGEATRCDNRDRAGRIKDRLSILDLAEARHADPYPSAAGHSCDCPACRNVGKADLDTARNRFRCRECGASGDVVTFEQCATGLSFREVCDRLEEFLERQDVGGGDLFAEGAA